MMLMYEQREFLGVSSLLPLPRMILLGWCLQDASMDSTKLKHTYLSIRDTELTQTVVRPLSVISTARGFAVW